MVAALALAYVLANQFAGYRQYRLAMAAAEKEDYATAVSHISRAAKHASRYESWEHYLRGYAQTGNEDFRRKSEETLARLETLDTDKAYASHAGRIRRCLETRVIPPH